MANTRKKSTKRWFHRHVQDPYVKQAQDKGYRSRAAFKLLQIQQRDKIFKPGLCVVDLGATPGGWSQVASELIGQKGSVIAVDRLPLEAIAGVTFLLGDFTHDSTLQQIQALLKNKVVDLVISDMAPNISGNSVSDQANVMMLAELVLEFAKLVLKPEGDLLIKIFQGEGFDEYVKNLRLYCRKLVIRKPEASKSQSKEVYLLARGWKIQK